jgi:hypothetical protein
VSGGPSAAGRWQAAPSTRSPRPAGTAAVHLTRLNCNAPRPRCVPFHCAVREAAAAVATSSFPGVVPEHLLGTVGDEIDELMAADPPPPVPQFNGCWPFQDPCPSLELPEEGIDRPRAPGTPWPSRTRSARSAAQAPSLMALPCRTPRTPRRPNSEACGWPEVLDVEHPHLVRAPHRWWLMGLPFAAPRTEGDHPRGAR